MNDGYSRSMSSGCWIGSKCAEEFEAAFARMVRDMTRWLYACIDVAFVSLAAAQVPTESMYLRRYGNGTGVRYVLVARGVEMHEVIVDFCDTSLDDWHIGERSSWRWLNWPAPGPPTGDGIVAMFSHSERAIGAGMDRDDAYVYADPPAPKEGTP